MIHLMNAVSRPNEGIGAEGVIESEVRYGFTYKIIFGLFEILYIAGLAISFFVMLAGSDDPHHTERLLHILIFSVFFVFFGSCMMLMSAVVGKVTRSKVRLGIIAIALPITILIIVAVVNAIYKVWY